MDGKEAKWADIDDDEDDWAPETIEWNDGTKITLSHTDSAAVLAEEQAAAQALKERQEEQNRAKMPPPKSTSTVGPNATVLRLGAGGTPRTGGLVLKNPSDKPTLVAKPSAPAPVRSPWAQLPPVDKVPPIPINPTAQSPASRFQQPDSHGPEGTSTPTSAAMEIAADSFTRTRRDSPNGGPGQLYNSQSGQYETVSAPRRSSMRKDQNFRPPSLLQRPQHNDQHGPAEPSAAFQTHRGHQQEATLWNRRTSSTVSGDSSTPGRRASMSKGSDIPRIPHELLQQRRESQPLQSPLTPGPGQGRFSQENAATSQPSPQTNALSVEANTSTSPQQSKPLPYGASTASRTLNDVAAQKQLMREKRELAVKRKKEEEEKGEAEKRERIRIKMEALGLPPLTEKKELEKVIPLTKVVDHREPEKPMIEPTGTESKESNEEKIQPSTMSPAVPAPAPRSPPKPPVLDTSGAPKQYGLIKMHGPALSNGVQPSGERQVPDASKPLGPAHQRAPSSSEVSGEEIQAASQLKINGDISSKRLDSQVPSSPETRNQDLFKVPRQQQPWKNIQNDPDPYTGWNSAGMTTHSTPGGNLWGPPTNFKSLGNGTFDRSVQRPQSRQPPYQEHYMQPPPQPIGPPKHLQRPRESPEPSRTPDPISAAPIAEDFQTIPTFPSSEAPRAPPISRGSMKSQSNSSENLLAVRPQPSPAAQTQPEVEVQRPLRSQEPPRSALAAWSNFHITSAREEAEKNRQDAQEYAARLAEEAKSGVRHEPQVPVMNETWRQVKIDDEAGRRQVVSVAKNLHGQMPSQQVNKEASNSPFATASGTIVGAGRGSRFFPGAGQGIQAQALRAVSYPSGFIRQGSPPPPDSPDHPAYYRDQLRPLVNLPYLKPKPTVRLPPSFATPVHSPVMADVQIVPLRAVSQPLVNNPSWQDRFRGLLGGKRPSPEKKSTYAMEFSATTKVPLDVPTVQTSTAVSLPQKEDERIEVQDNGEIFSRLIEEEEALFENREFGSLITVLIPTEVPSAVGRKSGKIQNKEPVQAIDAESIKYLQEKGVGLSTGSVIYVKISGMEMRKPKTMRRSKGYGPNQGPQRNNTRQAPVNLKGGRGYKQRDSSGSYGAPPKSAHQNNNQRTPMPNGVNPQTRTPFGKHNPNWGLNQRVANPV